MMLVPEIKVQVKSHDVQDGLNQTNISTI